MMWLSIFMIGILINSMYYTESASITATLGCYTDFVSNSQDKIEASIISSSNTPSTCTTYCSSLNLPYSGTKNGNECYCSKRAPTIPSTECTMPCAGDSIRICGGENAVSVLFTNITILPATNSTKRGLCWFWDNPSSAFEYFSPSALPWLYNWQPFDTRKNGTFPNAEFVPMCPSSFEAPLIPVAFSTCHGKYLLGFNEPDMPYSKGGSLLAPYEASVIWKKYIQPVKEKCGIALGAPAVSNAVGSGLGIDWLHQFFGNCTSPSCTFDFIPFHWYGNPLSSFQAYVNKFHGTFPTYPLWITEWQFYGTTPAETAILEQQALQWLDSQEHIVRYSMFAPSTAELMNYVPNGAMIKSDFSGLTDVGKVYAGLM